MTAVAFAVHVKEYPPRITETVRPYRLWDANRKGNVPHRYYATERRALDSALLLIRWGNIGYAIEVYDARTAKWCASYVRKVNSIAFTR